MNINVALKKRINELAKENNLSIWELNIKAGLNYNTINKLNEIRDGKPKTLSILSIYKICQALNITLACFFSPEYFKDLDTEGKVTPEENVMIESAKRAKKVK